jgi:hypothetical protein
MVLKKNNFTFNGDHYLQINGRARSVEEGNGSVRLFMSELDRGL